jgi:phosphate-selective porin OprO/OprP
MRARLLVSLLAPFAFQAPWSAAAQGTPTPAPPPADAAPATTPADAAPPPAPEKPAAVDGRLDDLDQKIRIIERRWEVDQEIAAERKAEEKKNPPGVAVAYGKDGVVIKSADNKFQFRFRPVVQADGRFFAQAGTDTFLLRRVRPVIEGTVFEFFDWRMMPELAGTPNVQDAYVNLRFTKVIQLRGGKFKPPVGLERLQSDPDLQMMERGLPTNLVPDRDIGVMLHGELFDGAISYAGGVFNGVGDGVNGDVDNNDHKDVAARIFIRPLAPASFAPLEKLSIGVAATRGTHTGVLPGYRTPGQTSFFSYVDGAFGTGTHRRIAPQATYYYGPIGLLGEYARSSQIVTNGTSTERVDHTAWEVVASVFITGEEASFTTVTPKNQLDPEHGKFGAFEISGRIGQLRIDDDAFALGFADRNKSAAKADELGVGLNWHLARNFKLSANYERTRFEGGAKGGDKPTEIVVLTRLQAAY